MPTISKIRNDKTCKLVVKEILRTFSHLLDRKETHIDGENSFKSCDKGVFVSVVYEFCLRKETRNRRCSLLSDTRIVSKVIL